MLCFVTHHKSHFFDYFALICIVSKYNDMKEKKTRFTSNESQPTKSWFVVVFVVKVVLVVVV